MVEMRKCTGTCGLEKELNKDNFYYSKGKPNAQCKDCIKQKMAKKYEENKEELLAKNKKYRQTSGAKTQRKKHYNKNKEKLNKQSREYGKNNKQIISKRNKKHRAKNKKKLNAKNKIYADAHKEEKKIYDQQYREANKQIIKEKDKLRYEKNKVEILAKNRINSKIHYEKNKEKIISAQTEYKKNRRHTDPAYKLRCIVSATIYQHLKEKNSSKNKQSSTKFLEFTSGQLHDYLESQFEPWMTWDNYGKYNPKTWKDDDPTTWTWNIDHIIPQADLPYTSMEDENFKKCWALSNLRPYSAKQNLLDGVNKIRHRKVG